MKALKRITVLLAVMLPMTYQGFSQNGSSNTIQKNSLKTQISTEFIPGKFIDTNKDGVCDNYQARMNQSRGANFVDKNGDGICDNRPGVAQGRCNPNGCGMGYQHRHGRGQGNCCIDGNKYQHRHGKWNQNSPTSVPLKTIDKN
ncbi:MAG: hypothetical protein M0Q38_07765 [Bacteroidales bacterium]|nr:hypothetical protein [Bacteroidales bacterium]